MTFEPVYQRTSSDCVVCCLAMYLGVSYEEARAMVQDHPGGGVCFNQAVEALRKRGRSARRSVYFFSGFPAILDLPSLNLVGRMHACYWDGEKAWDPNAGKSDRLVWTTELVMVRCAWGGTITEVPVEDEPILVEVAT